MLSERPGAFGCTPSRPPLSSPASRGMERLLAQLGEEQIKPRYQKDLGYLGNVPGSR